MLSFFVNNVIRLEISPAMEHTKDFSLSDWKDLWNQFVREFDNQEIYDAKGILVSGKTHLALSMATVWLHKESKSGTPHLHAAVCRIDQNGRVNNDHAIHLRAQRAAEIIARRYGWTTACEIRDNNLKKVWCVAMSCQKAMPKIETYSQWQPGTTRVSVSLNEGVYDRYIPEYYGLFLEEDWG